MAPADPRQVEEIARLLANRVRQDAARSGIARRDAHPKPHGLVSARFEVSADLPPALRHGLFATPRTFPAWIRFSNGSPRVQSDRRPDQRGMAIKVMGVPGEKLQSDPGEELAHDLVLASAPCFFIRTADDYVSFVRAQVKRPAFRVLAFFVGPNPLRWRLHELRALIRSLKRTADLLDTRYWSQVPYRLGPNIVKYSARPASTAACWPSSRDPQFLRTRLIERLKQGPVAFDFLVQVQTDTRTMPSDDATVEWDEARAPFHKVASIHVPRQDIDTAERWATVDRLAFSPWHCLAEHEPLGPMNQIRRQVYLLVASTRAEINGQRESQTTAVG
ncbi:MAG: catalase family protein [Vicinamibacterales bacterium]